jgi:hypothetical protein
MTKQPPPSTHTEEEIDPKEFVLTLADAGMLRLGLPVEEQFHAVLEELGFLRVRVEREPVHAVFILRANIGPTLTCTNVSQARALLREAARKIGRRIMRGVLHPQVSRTTVRAALLFDGVVGEAETPKRHC